MLRWFFDRLWASKQPASQLDGRLEAARFTVHKGRRYRAVVVLSGFETWASNETIADKLKDVGFKNVDVPGSGSRRIAEGLWAKEDVAAEIDPHLTQITELA